MKKTSAKKSAAKARVKKSAAKARVKKPAAKARVKKSSVKARAKKFSVKARVKKSPTKTRLKQSRAKTRAKKPSTIIPAEARKSPIRRTKLARTKKTPAKDGTAVKVLATIAKAGRNFLETEDGQKMQDQFVETAVRGAALVGTTVVSKLSRRAAELPRRARELNPKASAEVVARLNSVRPRESAEWTQTTLHDFLRSFVKIEDDGPLLILAPRAVVDFALGSANGKKHVAVRSAVQGELDDLVHGLRETNIRPKQSATNPTYQAGWKRFRAVLEKHGVSTADVRKIMKLQGVHVDKIVKWTR